MQLLNIFLPFLFYAKICQCQIFYDFYIQNISNATNTNFDGSLENPFPSIGKANDFIFSLNITNMPLITLHMVFTQDRNEFSIESGDINPYQNSFTKSNYIFSISTFCPASECGQSTLLLYDEDFIFHINTGLRLSNLNIIKPSGFAYLFYFEVNGFFDLKIWGCTFSSETPLIGNSFLKIDCETCPYRVLSINLNFTFFNFSIINQTSCIKLNPTSSNYEIIIKGVVFKGMVGFGTFLTCLGAESFASIYFLAFSFIDQNNNSAQFDGSFIKILANATIYFNDVNMNLSSEYYSNIISLSENNKLIIENSTFSRYSNSSLWNLSSYNNVSIRNSSLFGALYFGSNNNIEVEASMISCNNSPFHLISSNVLILNSLRVYLFSQDLIQTLNFISSSSSKNLVFLKNNSFFLSTTSNPSFNIIDSAIYKNGLIINGSQFIERNNITSCFDDTLIFGCSDCITQLTVVGENSNCGSYNQCSNESFINEESECTSCSSRLFGCLSCIFQPNINLTFDCFLYDNNINNINSTTNNTNSTNNTTNDNRNHKNDDNDDTGLILAIVIPISVVVILLIIGIYVYKRKNISHNKKYDVVNSAPNKEV